MEELRQVPFDFYPCKLGVNGQWKGYYVTLFLLTTWTKEELRTYSFWRVADQLENACLVRELGIPCECHTKKILVTSDNQWREVFDIIQNYVSETSFDSQC